jgi:hypothetical protein
MAKSKRYNREELSAMVDKELRQALGAPGGEIWQVRKRNLEYYQADAIGELAAPSVPDRSRIVATDVADTVESMLPSLVRTFASSQDAVECSPRTARSAPQAKMASEYLRHVFWQRCDGFSVLHNWFKDALIQKVGFVKVCWDSTPQEVTQEYRGLTAEQASEMLQEPGAEVLEQEVRQEVIEGMPVTLYDLEIKRVLSKGRSQVLNVPPEEMRIHQRARYGEEPLFIAQETSKSRGELEADGYDLTGISSTGGLEWEHDEVSRSIFDRQQMAFEEEGEMEQFRVAEVYWQLDQNNDGKPEWLKILMIGDTVMEEEEVQEHPFAYFCPSPIPHVFFGLCPADQAIEPQRLNTSLMRALVDNTYLTVNQRQKVLSGQVNLDDLLNSRPGGLVRVERMDALMPLEQQQLSPAAWQMVEWADQWRERRTGFTRYSQGLKADALSPQTAYGASVIAEKDDMRMELIARVAADSVRTMMQKLLRCMSRYQDVADQVELFGEWASIDPRVWDECFDIKVNVGLGVGNKDKRAQTLLQVISLQQPMVQAGMVAPQSAVAAAMKFAEAAGLSDAQDFFQPAQPQPPQPDPRLQFEQAKAQAEMQMEQQKTAAQMQMEQQRMQMQAEVDTNRQAAEQAQQQSKMQAQMELERYKAELQSQLELQKSQIQQETQLAIARINAESRLDAAQVSAQATLTAQQESATDAAVNS